jgi:hypothetical protein
MVHLEGLLILDVAMAIILVVLASLSKRLGEALKILHYYKFMYAAIVFIVVASLTDTLSASWTIPHLNSMLSRLIPNLLRCVAGVVSVISVLPYWKWLFSEFSKH